MLSQLALIDRYSLRRELTFRTLDQLIDILYDQLYKMVSSAFMNLTTSA